MSQRHHEHETMAALQENRGDYAALNNDSLGGLIIAMLTCPTATKS